MASKETGKGKNESRHVVSQDSCMLLQLPGELRNLIYSHLFTSITLTFDERGIFYGVHIGLKTAPNSLAILRTCRLIKQEAGSLWLGHVLFNFKHPEDMLDMLSVQPSTTLSQIRHIRVTGQPTVIMPIGHDDDVYYRLVWALKLLPGLCLDTLHVFSEPSGLIAYDTLGGLIQYGNSWKELHYTTPNSEMLGFAKKEMFLMDPYWRKPQPSTWNDIMTQRDGLDSGASVTIYRSTRSDAPGTVLKPETRQVFEQKPPPSEDLETFGVEEDKQLLGMNEKGKELLVVVKRGHQANISEPDGPPYLEQDIRQWAHGLSWAEIRRQCIDFHESSDDDEYEL